MGNYGDLLTERRPAMCRDDVLPNAGAGLSAVAYSCREAAAMFTAAARDRLDLGRGSGRWREHVLHGSSLGACVRAARCAGCTGGR